MKKTYFIIGWLTTLVGSVFLILELFSLVLIQNAAIALDYQTAMGLGFSNSAIEYGKIAPMPTIFVITGLIIILGIALTVYSFINPHKEK